MASGGGIITGGPGIPALVIPVPDHLWQAEGTLAFRFRPSRQLQFQPDQATTLLLAQSPLFTLKMTETPHAVDLQVIMSHDGNFSEDEEMEISNGSLSWAFLRADQWYDFALTWNAAEGKLAVYLNGTLQEELRLKRPHSPWPIPKKLSGNLILGGVEIQKQDTSPVEIPFRDIELWTQCLTGDQLRSLCGDFANPPLAGEGRWEFTDALDVSPYNLSLFYEADFSRPLDVVMESDLFENGERVRQPQSEWVLEGSGRAYTDSGACIVESVPRDFSNALVLWSTRKFPRDLLIEFTMQPENPSRGLGIVFFATRNLQGGSPFEPGMPIREGRFARYHSGLLNGYHVSYWSCNSRPGNILRRTSNLRKNNGFILCAVGPDHIGGSTPGPKSVRILKFDNTIQVETDGKMALSWRDDGSFAGPPRDDGWIGLRQMGSADRITYRDFRVWQVFPAENPEE